MDARRLAGAMAGGLVAGLGISALLLLGERKSGEPSELIRLERTTLARLGEEVPPTDRMPELREQAAVQGGHLALSALAGAAYAGATDENSDVLGSGVAFGLAFYLSMHWLLGPLLRVKAPEWRAPKGQLGMHALNHILFGITTAAAAKPHRRPEGATMKAVVFHAIGDIRVDEVPDPVIEQPTDAIVRLTASAICGTDLHFVRGTFSGMKKGQTLGHEGVGVVEAIGPEVKKIAVGQRVIIPSTIGCGACSFCRNGFFAQCDNANPLGKRAGTAFFGGPEGGGGYKGLQAEKARCPWADVNLVPIPDGMDDDTAILLSDILPTAWFGADLAEIEEGDHVLVFGCGPVGLLTVASARLMGGRVIAVDRLPDRLAKARELGAEAINFDEVDVPDTVLRLTDGDGARRVIDAVGVDAQHAHGGPDEPGLLGKAKQLVEQYAVEPMARKFASSFRAGDNPSQALDWAVECVAKGGTIAIIGVYPPTDRVFPIGVAMNKNVTLRMGNANHRRYYDVLIDHVMTGRLDPKRILSHTEPATGAIEAYRAFDERQPGWIKVELEPTA